MLEALKDTKTRDAAYCDLVRWGIRYRPAGAYPEVCLPVTEVLSAPQDVGPPLLLVFLAPGYPLERGPNRRNAAGPFSIFASNGITIPVFAAANLVAYDSELFTYAPNGSVAIGHVIDYGTTGWSVEVLHIVPTTIGQRPALSVVLGPPVFGFDDECKGFFWSWRYLDTDADGWPEIQIGPRIDETDAIVPSATYRWSRAKGRYDGPAGSVEQGFMTFRSAEATTVHRRFAEYWRPMQKTREGHRKSWCTSIEGSSSGVE